MEEMRFLMEEFCVKVTNYEWNSIDEINKITRTRMCKHSCRNPSSVTYEYFGFINTLCVRLYVSCHLSVVFGNSSSAVQMVQFHVFVYIIIISYSMKVRSVYQVTMKYMCINSSASFKWTVKSTKRTDGKLFCNFFSVFCRHTIWMNVH